MSPPTNKDIFSTENFSTTNSYPPGKKNKVKPSNIFRSESFWVLFWYLTSCGKKGDLYDFVKAIIKGRLADREDLIEGTQYASFGEDEDKEVTVEEFIQDMEKEFAVFREYCLDRCCSEREFVDQYATVRDSVIEAIQGGFVQQILDGVNHR